MAKAGTFKMITRVPTSETVGTEPFESILTFKATLPKAPPSTLTKLDIAKGLLKYALLCLGCLDFVTDVYYYASTDFESQGLKTACLFFLCTIPFYGFFATLFLGVYFANFVPGKKNRRLGLCMIALSPLMSIAITLKLIGFLPLLLNDDLLVSSAWSLILMETLVETLPQIIIQATNNYLSDNWSIPCIVSFSTSALMCVKELCIIGLWLKGKVDISSIYPKLRRQDEFYGGDEELPIGHWSIYSVLCCPPSAWYMVHLMNLKQAKVKIDAEYACVLFFMCGCVLLPPCCSVIYHAKEKMTYTQTAATVATCGVYPTFTPDIAVKLYQE